MDTKKYGSIAEFVGRPLVVRYFCVSAGISGHVWSVRELLEAA